MGDPAEKPDPTVDPVKSPEGAARRLRPVRGGLVALLGGLVAFCLMAYEHQWRLSVPVGALSMLLVTWGVLDFAGTFEPSDDDDVRSRVGASALGRPLVGLGAAVVSHLSVLTLAVSGVLPKPLLTAAALVTATFLWIVVSVFRLARALGAWRSPDGSDDPLAKRHGFWLVAITTLLYLPMLGSYSLSDPWETHYGEVAREMLARDDWISLWWAQDGWFWSKPIFDFWAQGLSFAALGVRYQPDEMLQSIAQGRFPQPEWAARMPIFIVTVLGTYFLYRAVARVWGRRAGLLAGIALTTMPYWFLIGHQTMTDMPYVGTLTAGLCLILLGFVTDPEARVPTYEITAGRRTWRVSLFHVIAGAVTLCVVPQILYLASRNLTLHLSEGLYGFRFHPDEFTSGSGMGNCGLPGNQGCSPQNPTHPEVWPIHSAAIWLGGLALYFWIVRSERRTSRLCLHAGWLFVALAAMAKGAPGLAIPIATIGAFVLATRRWKDLQRAELGVLVVTLTLVVFPWYVQMYLRHGHPFIDRLIMHDMYKRAFVHVHDTNQGDDVSFRYYVWQLGYGLFPWTGLSAAGLVAWLRNANRTPDQRGDAAVFMAMWFLSTFGMFTITLTKFHHYIFPLVPTTAVLTGVLVDRTLGSEPLARPGKLAVYLGGLGVGVLLLVYGVTRLFPRTISGLAIDGEPSRALAYGCIFVGALLSIGSPLLFGARGSGEGTAAHEGPPVARALHDSAVGGLVGVVALVSLVLAGRDLIVSPDGDPEGSARLMQLFTYNYKRAWPTVLDYTGALSAFTAVGAAACLGFLFARARKHAVTGFVALSMVFCAWGVNVYLVHASPHWGQRETVMAYYEHRSSPDEPLVAYQMNWKGENFYTGNRVPAFVSSGKKFKDWVEQQRSRGVHVMFFTTEHARIGSLKRELDQPEHFETVTDKTLNNKFVLARVELDRPAKAGGDTESDAPTDHDEE